MSNDTSIRGSISVRPSDSTKIHDLTMLYLKNQDLSNLTVSEIAKKYKDTESEFKKGLLEQRSTYFV